MGRQGDKASGGMPAGMAGAILARMPEENPDPVLRLSGEPFTVLYANPAALSAFEPLGLAPGSVAPPVLGDPARLALRQARRVQVEIECGGAAFALSAVPAGSDVNLYCHDITARNRAEEALRASEERERTVSENIRDSLVVLLAVRRREDGEVVDWRYLDANEGACRLLGTTRAALVGKTLRQVLPERHAAMEQRFRRVLATGTPERYEAEVRDATLLVTIFRIDANTVGSAALDITDRNRAELALREREAELRLAQRIAHVGSWSWTVGTERLEASEEVVRIYGRDPALPLPANDSEELRRHYTPEGWERRAAAFRRALHDGLPWERDEEIVRLDGSRRWVHFRGEPERDAHGRIAKLRGTIQDITERKAAEDAVREADQRKTEFLGVLSHELRNPLAPIRNSIFLMEKLPSDSPQVARARQVIRRQTEHLTRLVDDLLDVTRISRGKIQLDRVVLDLRNVVRRTCEDHRALFEECEIDLSLDFPAAPVWADVDATRIAQVVGNLLNNSIKFTSAGGPVSVRLRGRGGHAEICVRDTGAGMEPRQVDRMFEPFAQEDRSLARTKGGLGLGLALSRGLVELHGGTITAYSEGPGKGAELQITLPLAKRATQGSAVPPAALGSGSRRRVLLIEDNVDAGRTLADVLEAIGHEVTIARDGTAGIALARELRPEVVICDLGLPDVDGYEVARVLRQHEALRSTRLIALSGYAQPEDKERAREAGFDAHLPKPAPIDELAELLG